MFYRVSTAVIAPDLVETFRLNTESLGVLGGAFFYSFALMQIPMGVLLDRIGPRFVMTIFGLIGACGALVFAGANTFLVAIAGRILMGVGMASVLMGSLKVFVLRFPGSKFSTLSGALISIGTLGSILATSPLAWLSLNVGWRLTFVVAGCATILCAFLIFWALKTRDGQEEIPSDPALVNVPKTPIKKLLPLVLGSLSFWQISAFAFFRYGTFVALQGLWLGTYLMDVKGLSSVEAGNILMMLSIGYIAGTPIAGYLSDRVIRSAKLTAFGSVTFYTVCLLPLTGFVNITNPVFFWILFFMLGFFNGPGTLAYTHVKELYPIHISGTVIAAVNFFVMAGGAVLTPSLGLVIAAITPKNQLFSPVAYHWAFLVCFLGIAASLIFYAFSKTRQIRR